MAAQIPDAIVQESPGGQVSLILDLEHWKPRFLALVDDVVEMAADPALRDVR